MSRNTFVVSGEASETDSENETDPSIRPLGNTHSVQGAIITGEDSESENETDGVSCAVSVLSTPIKESDSEFNTLLHKKLCESNKQLVRELEIVTHNKLNELGDTLNVTEHDLLKSQITLQSTLTSLRTLSNNALGIKTKLRDILTAKFLPTVLPK